MMKRLAILIAALACAGAAQGVLFSIPPVTTTAGIGATTVVVPVPNATVTICTYQGSGIPCSPPATVYSDQALTTTTGNVLATNAQGQVPVVWLAQGTYIYTVQGASVTGTSFTFSAPVVCAVGVPCVATVQSLAVTSPAITPTGIEQVRYADQYPGADVGAKINAAEAACPAAGCTIDLGTTVGAQALTTQIVLSKPTTLLLRQATLDCSAVASPCIALTAGQSAIVGPAQGVAAAQNIVYSGNPGQPYDVVKAYSTTAGAETAYDRFENMLIQVTTTGTQTIAAIHSVDAVGLELHNVFISHHADIVAKNSPIVGYWAEVATSGLVPAAGFTRIENFLYTGNVDSAAGAASKGIWLGGAAGKPIVNVSIGGFCNVEDADVGIELDSATNVSVPDGCLLQGDGTAVSLAASSDNSFRMLRTNATFVAPYSIDAASFDNVFTVSSFSAGDPAGLDNGGRTTWLNTATGFVALPYVAGPVRGAPATSGVNVNSALASWSGNYWTGAVNAACTMTSGLYFAAGSQPHTDFTFSPVTCPSGMDTTFGTALGWGGGGVIPSSAAVALTSQLPLSGSVAGSTTSLAANSCGDTVTATVTGATTAMTVSASSPAAFPAAANGLTVKAAVTAANTVSVGYCNATTAPIVPAAATIQIRVVQ